MVTLNKNGMRTNIGVSNCFCLQVAGISTDKIAKFRCFTTLAPGKQDGFREVAGNPKVTFCGWGMLDFVGYREYLCGMLWVKFSI